MVWQQLNFATKVCGYISSDILKQIEIYELIPIYFSTLYFF